MNTNLYRQYLSKLVWIISSLLFAFWTAPAWAIETNFLDLDSDKVDLLFYGGKFTDTDLLPILGRQDTKYMESYLAVGGLNYKLDATLLDLNFEAEGHLAKHFGIMRHTELNGALIARWKEFIPGLPISLAFGEGLSLASRRPRLEHRRINIYDLRFRGQKTKPLLNYIMLELDYSLPDLSDYDPRLFFRIHHRSGVFGLYCPPTCGSNFITYGLKFSL